VPRRRLRPGGPAGGSAGAGDVLHRGRRGASAGHPQGEELVGAGEERVRLHRPLCEALAADEVARREELLGDLQPA